MVPEVYSAGVSFLVFAFSTNSFHVLLMAKRSMSYSDDRQTDRQTAMMQNSKRTQ